MTVVNLMSAPGAGKTTLLERVLGSLDVRAGVLEGDVQGSYDADRLASLHVPVTQLNTDPGFGGECHLDANMVRSALPALPLDDLDLLVIENVGNLVCPAEFRVGEDARVMISSVTEGEDKPLKYPLMFRTCELVVINKIDLLPHLDFDMERFLHNLDAVHPDVPPHAGERAHGRGRRGLPRLAAEREGAGLMEALAVDRRREANAVVVRGRGGAAGEAVRRDGGALRPRRAAAGHRRRLGRPPRGGRVRAPRDRRQAGAARAGRHRRASSSCSPSPTTW